MCRMEPIPGTETTPIIPDGMALGQLIMDTAPTKHPASMLQICPHRENVYIQCSSGLQTLLVDGFARVRCISGLRLHFRSQIGLCVSCHSVTGRICRKQPPPIRSSAGQSDTDYSDSSCQELPATTCLF